jgi:hypothetical protein
MYRRMAEHKLSTNSLHASLQLWYKSNQKKCSDRLCGLVVRAPGHRSRGLGSIPGATRFSEK